MSMMSLDGYKARIEYDADLDLLRGDILGLSGGADFYGKDLEELRTEFRSSLQVYLEVCRENDIAPESIHSLAREALRQRLDEV